ncbi:hypothetical protein ONE63_000114 [Megalurothrips usitatus]|uniref:Uncharacterized protein n=1 Tax=Megalurothrips usitatus TaxID=439358 RepID=A0AAV7XXG5_9NEOP|nr:hypothetical protein ONE63_000114 [Megalurothrips usitatus]
MDCHMDPEWTLQLLYDLSMSADEVQQAQVWRPSWDHLSVLHTMPHLRRLFLYHCYDVDAGAALPALPEGRAGLHTLRVDELPRRPLASLLRAHGSSLHTLILFVGTGGAGGWPHSCDDLHDLLGECRLTALRALLLCRWGCAHDGQGCAAQRGAVRRLLPAVESVQCEVCDGVAPEPF